MGCRGETDMLNIAYSLSPYSDEAGNGSVELQDKYLRLDKQLERLFDAIDNRVGLKNTLIVVSSTGYFEDNASVDPKYNIPTGEFSLSKAKSLLNLYLMAVYGNAQWVDDYKDESFYLNHKLIKEKNINLKEIRKNASDFLRRMSGVANSYSLDEIIDNPTGAIAQRMHNGLVTGHVGDVMIKILPGWTIVINDNNTQAKKEKYVRSSVISSPTYILHPSIKAQKINAPVDATILAPTVSRLLRIRSPNAAMEKPYIFE